MPGLAQRGDRVFFGLCALAGALILVGSAQPGYALYLNTSSGLAVPRPWLAVPVFLAVVVLIALASIAWSLRDYE